MARISFPSLPPVQAAAKSAQQLRIVHIALVNDGCQAAGTAASFADWATGVAEALQRGPPAAGGLQRLGSVEAHKTAPPALAADAFAQKPAAEQPAVSSSTQHLAAEADSNAMAADTGPAAAAAAPATETAPPTDSQAPNEAGSSVDGSGDISTAAAATPAKGSSAGRKRKAGARLLPPGLWRKILSPLRSGSGEFLMLSITP